VDLKSEMVNAAILCCAFLLTADMATPLLPTPPHSPAVHCLRPAWTLCIKLASHVGGRNSQGLRQVGWDHLAGVLTRVTCHKQ
jgi:hypothetical protein